MNEENLKAVEVLENLIKDIKNGKKIVESVSVETKTHRLISFSRPCYTFTYHINGVEVES